VAIAAPVLACAFLLAPGGPVEGAEEIPSSGAAAVALQQAAPDTTERSERELRNLRAGTPNDAWTSSYEPLPAEPTVIRDATVMTAAGEELEATDVLLRDGRIEAIGSDLDVPAGTREVDGSGRYVTPGLIDAHSHIGVSATPEVGPHYDNNEVGTTTPEVWIHHSIWPQGPGFGRALAGGTTTAMLLPGSGDLIEGRGAIVKMVPARTPQGMLFPGAPDGLKMACGENPKGGGFPSTRMGNVAGYRNAFIQAQGYRERWDAWLEDPSGEPPDRDLGMETLAQALRGEILVHVHCYRADDIAAILELAREFDFDVRSIHHGVEAYKVRDLLAEHGASASVWPDWWGFKMEAFDGIPQNAALLSDAGARAVIHTDSDMGIQTLNQEAAVAMQAGREAGLDVSRNEALRWVTANPAWTLGIEDRVGTIEVGKNADVVLWSGDPFSVYAVAEKVWIDGARVYDRSDGGRRPLSDFELGMPGQGKASGVDATVRREGTGGQRRSSGVPGDGG
jgi:imidazolonepropionase-like amidohydrolase